MIKCLMEVTNMPTDGRPKVLFRLDPWEKHALECYAAENSTTVSDIMRDLMTALFTEHGIDRNTYPDDDLDA